MKPALVLSKQPDWHAAAQELANQMLHIPEQDERVRLLEAICVRLDNGLYPALLHLLYCIEQFGDSTVKQEIVGTLQFAMSTGRLPSGKLPAWGASEQMQDNPFGQTRNVGPIEFLCAWYAQPSNLPTIDRNTFTTICTSMIRLVSSDLLARDMYREKLLVDADDPLSGSLSSKTRHAIRNLATHWQDDITADELVTQFLDSLQVSSSLNQLNTIKPF